jgi:hypothetical protein
MVLFSTNVLFGCYIDDILVHFRLFGNGDGTIGSGIPALRRYLRLVFYNNFYHRKNRTFAVVHISKVAGFSSTGHLQKISALVELVTIHKNRNYSPAPFWFNLPAKEQNIPGFALQPRFFVNI